MKHSTTIKNILLQIGFMRLCRKLFNTRSAAILRYHAIITPEDNFYVSPSICITLDQFEKQVRYLSAHYNIISIDVLTECIINQKPFPEKSVVLTFDDGYRDNYQAYRILKKYGVQGTFYICAGCIENGEPLWLFEVIYLIRATSRANLTLQIKGKNINFSLSSQDEKKRAIQKITGIIKSNSFKVRENVRVQLKNQIKDVLDFEEKASKVMLTWEQVQEMYGNGMTIGAHTMTHLNLPNAVAKDAGREINNCKAVLEERIGAPIYHFSYPNGGNYDYFNESIKNMVKEAKYKSSTTSNNGLVELKSDLFELSRVRVARSLSEIIWQMNCEPLIKKALGK